MQVTGDGDAFNLLVAPAHFARDDFAVLADAYRMALRVSILDIDGRGKGLHRLFIDFSQTIIEPLVLNRFVLDFFE